MIKILFFIRILIFHAAAVLLLNSSIRASMFRDTLNTDMEAPENIRGFADYLFEQKDYLRAFTEYSKLTGFINDTVQFRMASALGEMGRYNEAGNLLNGLIGNSKVRTLALHELMKNRWLVQDFRGLRTLCDTLKISADAADKSCSPLYYASYLIDSVSLPGTGEFENAFPPGSRDFMKGMYERKIKKQYKSPLKAALLSAIIPGAGKIYAGQTSDGITAFIVSGLLGYLALDNFISGHDFRAWTFTGLGALFYAGNIYGSAAQAQIFNAGIKYNFQNDLNIFVREKNYFKP